MQVLSFYLSNITNFNEFLGGQRPILGQVGPVRMREYVQLVNVSVTDDKVRGVRAAPGRWCLACMSCSRRTMQRFKRFQSWSSIVPDPSNDATMLDTPVIIPNPAFFTAKATIQGGSAGAQGAHGH